MDVSPYAVSAPAVIVKGPAGTGKTEALVREAARLLNEGIPDQNLMVFAASPLACQAFRKRLAEHAEGKAQNVRILTVKEFALKVLADQKTVAETGREGTILLKFEEHMLMEDMKTSKVHPKRLREMLKFFYRSWGDLEPMDSPWFYSNEEEGTYNLLACHLAHRKAYLPQELSRAAYDYLISHADALEAVTVPHVFVDDYQTLSRASQCLAGLICGSTLWAAGDSDARIAVLDEYPDYEGLSKLAEANPSHRLVSLSASHSSPCIASAVEALRSNMPFSEAIHENSFKSDACTLLDANRPEDEIERIVRYVKSALDSGIDPEDIAIATPHSIWEKRIAHTLHQEGIESSYACAPSFGGDIRAIELCGEAQAITLLRLIANRNSQTALRSWCGFGDHLANSGVISHAVQQNAMLSIEAGICWQPGSHPTDALARQGEARINKAMRQASFALDAIGQATGSELLSRIEAIVGDGSTKRIALMAQEIGPDATAADIVREIQNRSLFPNAIGHGVRLGSLNQFVGQNVDVMILAGMVNGFIPERECFDPTVVELDKRPTLIANARSQIYACAGKARHALVFSLFREADLSEAESLKLKVYRVRLRGKERLCEIHPSDALCPITGEGSDE